MDNFDLMERKEILVLALGEAHRRIAVIQDKINELEAEQNKYHELVENIIRWQKELKGQF